MDVPADTPVTMPVEVTVATAVLEELQTPPDVASANILVPRVQMAAVPVMDATTGNVFAVTVVLAEAVQPVTGVVTVTVYVPLVDAVTAAEVADPPVAFHR